MSDSIDKVRKSIFITLKELQLEGRKIFLSFIFGFLSCMVLLRYTIWPFFESVMTHRMSDEIANQVELIAQTPFEVFLIQVKIGLFIGLVFTIPVLFYIFNRRVLKPRGIILSKVPKVALSLTCGFGILFFVAGLSYSYGVFFPLIFDFLATVTIESGFVATYSIAKWTQFMVLLSVSFGLISQIPIFLPLLVRYKVIPYSMVRYGWKYWVILTLVLGAMLSPPDPLSQLLWAGPLILLYVLSIIVSKFVNPVEENKEVNQKTSGSEETPNQSSKNDKGDIIEGILSEESRNDEMGGYYFTMLKIWSAFMNNIVIILAIFLITMGVTFYALFAELTELFLNQFELQVALSEEFSVIALHPIDLILFQAKLSVLFGLIVTIPVAVWSMWPDLSKKKVVNTARSKVLFYTLLMGSSIIVFSAVGLLYIAPNLINILVIDALRIDALVTYRINSFFWIIFYIATGFGFLCTIYLSVIIGYIWGIIPYNTLKNRWRHIIFGILVFSVLFTPSSILKAILLTIPLCISFVLAVFTVYIIHNVYAGIRSII